MAAPTFFGKGVLNAENSGTSITPIDPPASTLADDIVVIGVGCNGSSTFTTPTDWTLLGTSLESDAGQSTEWYWRRLTAADAATTVAASATFSTTLGGYGQKWVFRGCITTGNPFESVGTAGTASETTPDSSAVTTTGPDRLVVCICLVDNDPDFASGFPPAGWSDMGGLSASTVGGDWMTRAMQRTEASATTVASAVVGTLGASTRWRTISFALIPPAAAPDANVTLTTIARSFTLPQVTVGVGAEPATIARPFSLPQPTVGVGAAPDTIARQVSLPQPTVSVGAEPASIARAFTLPQMSAVETVTVTPDTIDRAFTLPQIVATGEGGGEANVTLTTIARAFTIPQATVGVGVQLAVISLAFTVPQISAVGESGDATVTPDTIALAFALPLLAVDSGVASKPWKLLGGGAPIRGGYHKYAHRRAGWS